MVLYVGMQCKLYSCLKKQHLAPESILPGRTLYQLLKSALCHLYKVNGNISRQVSRLFTFIAKTNCPLPPLSCSLFGCFSFFVCLFVLLAVVSGPFKWLVWPKYFWTLERKSQKQAPLSSLPPSLLVSASSAGVCHPLLSPTDMCLPVYCCWPGRLVGVQAGALSLTLWNTTAVRLLPDSMLIVWFNAPMFNHEEKWREREIMIISSKFFCVGSHLYTFRMRCCLQNGKKQTNKQSHLIDVICCIFPKMLSIIYVLVAKIVSAAHH